jgi:hypothetical protein
MSLFPLYNNLIKDIPKKDLTTKQKDFIIKNIDNIDDNAKELVYVLIKFYSNNENKDNTENLPYKGLKDNFDKNTELYNITWNLLELPITLRQILYKFISLHMKQKEDEIKREF